MSGKRSRCSRQPVAARVGERPTPPGPDGRPGPQFLERAERGRGRVRRRFAGRSGLAVKSAAQPTVPAPPRVDGSAERTGKTPSVDRCRTPGADLACRTPSLAARESRASCSSVIDRPSRGAERKAPGWLCLRGGPAGDRSWTVPADGAGRVSVPRRGPARNPCRRSLRPIGGHAVALTKEAGLYVSRLPLSSQGVDGG